MRLKHTTKKEGETMPDKGAAGKAEPGETRAQAFAATPERNGGAAPGSSGVYDG